MRSEVLICGSESRDLAELRQLIGRQGYSVETARTPVNAIQQTRVSPFQAAVFLLDEGDEDGSRRSRPSTTCFRHFR